MQLEYRMNNRIPQTLLVLCSSMLLVLILAGCASGSPSNVSPAPTPISLVPLQLDIPQKALNAPVTGNIPDEQPLHIGITLKINQQALDQLAKNGVAQSNETTSADDIAKKLGVSDTDYQHLKDFFGIKGGSLKLSKTRTSMTLDIKAGALAQILQTKFVQHKLDNRTFYTPDPQHMPKIPAPLASSILAVTGLDNYSLPPTTRLSLNQKSMLSKQAAQAGACSTTGVSSNSLAHAYGYDQLWKQGWHGENMTINLVEIDGVDSNDVGRYFDCVGFKGNLDFTTIHGAVPAPGVESTLDIEMIAGLAPAAHIRDYQVDISKSKSNNDVWNDINDTLQQILDDNAGNPGLGSAVSISLGNSEDFITGEVAKSISQRLQLLTQAEHMTVYVASGDCGAYANRTPGTPNVSYPASDPWVVSVGGTEIATDSSSSRAKEIAWTGVPLSVACQYNEWGTGGGLSKLFKKPTWQQGPGVKNKYSNGSRQVPDVAAVADNLPIFFNGKWITAAGTSAATPIWAAGMALVNQGLIETKKVYVYGPSTFYLVRGSQGNLKPYYDEVQGTNWYYFAGPEWDYTTGLGSPNLAALYEVISNAAKA